MSDPSNQNNMLGDLPLISAQHFLDLGQEYWSKRGFNAYNVHCGAPADLERLQRLLHQKGQELDSVEGKENNLKVVSKYRTASYIRRYRNSKIPYHEDILPQWEAFADNVINNREGLQRINIDNIVLPTAPFFENKLLPILKNNNHTLTSLELNKCTLKSDQIKGIAKFLQKNKTLSVLDLSGNKMKDVAAAKSLAQAIKKHRELSFLNLSRCTLGASTSRNSRGGRTYNYGGNDELLSTLLGGCKKLKTLLLEDNCIKTEGTVAVLVKFLKNNKSLSVFSIEGNEMGNANVNVLCEALTKCTEISEVCLRRTKIALPTFINNKQMMNLTCLDMSGEWYWSRRNEEPCSIGAPGAKLIAKYLASNPALIDLNLSRHAINSHGAKKIALALKKNTNLQHLSLEGNRLTEACVPAFADALRNNNTLLTLNLGGNEIRVEKGRAVLNRNALCDISSLDAIAHSNHTCVLTTSEGKKYRNDVTKEFELKNINSLGSEGMKIRYKIVLALFSMNKDLFHPRSFDEVPLELMPRLLELVQQEIGFNGFGEGIAEKSTEEQSTRELRRLYQVVTEWNTPELVLRGPGKGSLTATGKLKTKRDKKKRVLKVADEDEDWTPNGAPKKKKRRNRWRAPSQQPSSGGAGGTENSTSRSKRSTRNTVSYADVENSEDES